MKKKIACLHAHFSNIDYIDNALTSEEVEFVHFVDPGLMRRMVSDPHFDEKAAANKVLEQIEWISQANVDAILLTCTNYIALLDESRLKSSIPIIKMDEPFFEYVCHINEPQILLFTNPATVEGTMRRLHDFAESHGKPTLQIEARVIENTFDLLMQGKKDPYFEAVSNEIRRILSTENNINVSVAQLSMVEAATHVEREFHVQLGHSLKSLAANFGSLLSK